jgi:hypothetical protein
MSAALLMAGVVATAQLVGHDTLVFSTGDEHYAWIGTVLDAQITEHEGFVDFYADLNVGDALFKGSFEVVQPAAWSANVQVGPHAVMLRANHCQSLVLQDSGTTTITINCEN